MMTIVTVDAIELLFILTFFGDGELLRYAHVA